MTAQTLPHSSMLASEKKCQDNAMHADVYEQQDNWMYHDDRCVMMETDSVSSG
jgi:hypothetical protein